MCILEGEGDIIAMITFLMAINLCVCRIRLVIDYRCLNVRNAKFTGLIVMLFPRN